MKRVDKMKIGVTLILWAIALLVSFGAFSYAKAESRCTLLAEFGEQAMIERQAGTSLAAAWEIAEMPELRLVLRMAWAKPRYQSREYQQRAIESFRDEVFLGCVEGRL